VKEDELADPEPIGLLRLWTEMTAAADDGHLVEQAGTVGGILTP
jgi:hypothetical protein